MTTEQPFSLDSFSLASRRLAYVISPLAVPAAALKTQLLGRIASHSCVGKSITNMFALSQHALFTSFFRFFHASS